MKLKELWPYCKWLKKKILKQLDLNIVWPNMHHFFLNALAALFYLCMYYLIKWIWKSEIAAFLKQEYAQTI